ncbi:MAG: ABC transporter substrate-binding protein [Candidatus Peribacteraceae bacterium]|nr:ABC transporter substrate-binding protein [Candidatus Peribacteraceae bacterium]
MKRLLTLSLLTLFLAACKGTTTTEPIKVGFIGPLTGEVSALGKDILHGAQIKLDEINATGGISGQQVVLIAEDGRCNATDAASAAQKLVQVDKVVAIHGGECSAETIAAAPIAEAAKVVMLSPSSSSPDVTKAGDFIFRDYPSDALKTQAMAKYFSNKELTKVAIIAENSDFTVGFRDSLKKDLPEGALVFNETVDPGTKDFRTLLTRLKGADIDVLVDDLNSPANIALLLQQFREQGFKQLVISHDLGDSLEIPKLIGKASEGFQVINVPTLDPSGDFGEKFIGKYGEPQANLAWGGYGYDVMGILLQAISSAGTDGTAIRDYLYQMSSYDGVIAKVSFDENGDIRGIPYVLREVKDGIFVNVSDITVN